MPNEDKATGTSPEFSVSKSGAESSLQNEVARQISKWATDKGAYTTIEAYEKELQIWSALSGVSSVSSAIEVGCGSGLFLLSAVVLGYVEEGVGYDPTISHHGTDENELRQTQELVARLDLSSRVGFAQRALDDLLKSDRKYDLIIFRNTLHHIYEQSSDSASDREVVKKCVEDLERARTHLKKGGRIYVLESQKRNRVHGLLYNLYRRVRHGIGPIEWESKRSAEEWKSLIEAAGFEEVEYARVPISKKIGSPAGDAIAELLSPAFLIAGR
jgi:hypothetical protein